MHKTTNLIFDIRLVETKKSKLSTLTSTRRNINGSSHEKRRHENFESHLLCRTIRHHNRSRSLLWSHHRLYFNWNYSHLLKLCSTEPCYTSYHGELVPEANTLYHGRMTALRQHIGLFNRNLCNRDLGDVP